MAKLKTAIAIIGNTISFGLSLSPMLIFKNIIGRGGLQEGFNAFPYLATSLNCMLWFIYELPVINPGNTLLLAINALGVLIEMIYLGIIIKFADQNLKDLIVWVVISEFLSTGTILAAMLVWVPPQSRLNIIGAFCVASGIIMYGSTLPLMVSAWKTRSTEKLPLALIVVGLANTAVWLAYGIRYHDLYILIQDGIGFVLCATQLTVYLIIRTRPDSTPA